jgi:hypothetical protein
MTRLYVIFSIIFSYDTSDYYFFYYGTIITLLFRVYFLMFSIILGVGVRVDRSWQTPTRVLCAKRCEGARVGGWDMLSHVTAARPALHYLFGKRAIHGYRFFYPSGKL